MTGLRPTEFKKFLLYARQMEIRGVDLDAPYYNYIISFTVPDIDNVTVLDYDAREQRVYWSDVRTQAIKRAFINGTGVETVVSAGSDAVVPIPGLAPSMSPCPLLRLCKHQPPTPRLCPQTCQMPMDWLWTGCPEICSGQVMTPTRSRLTWPGSMAPSRTPWCRAWNSLMAWSSTRSVGQSAGGSGQGRT